MRMLLGLVQLPLKVTLQLAGRAVSVVARATGDHGSDPRPTPPPARRATAPRRNGVAPPVQRPRPPFTGEPAPRAEAPPPVRDEPAHVSEEPELVAEVAERGAEQGAGAEVHVDPPWAGYDDMTAAEIRTRLQTDDATVAAAVSLYEAARKGRSSVLEAAARGTRPTARPSG